MHLIKKLYIYQILTAWMTLIPLSNTMHAQMSPCKTSCVMIPTNSMSVQNPRVALSPVRQCLAVTHTNPNQLAIYQINNDCTINTTATSIADLPGTPLHMAFSPDGSCLAIGTSNNHRLIVFSISENCNLSTQSTSTLPDPVRFVDFSPDGKCIAATVQNREIYLFNVTNCQLAGTAAQINGILALAAKFSPDGKCIFVARDGSIEGLSPSISSYTFNGCNDDPTLVDIYDVNIQPISLDISPDGSCLAAAGPAPPSMPPAIKFSINQCTLTQKTNINFSGTSAQSLSFSPNSSCIAVMGSNTLEIFSHSKCSAQSKQIISGTDIFQASYNSNSTCLAVATSTSVQLYRAIKHIQANFAQQDCNGNITITGTADPSATIEVTENSSIVPTTYTIDPSGNLTIEINASNVSSNTNHTFIITETVSSIIPNPFTNKTTIKLCKLS